MTAPPLSLAEVKKRIRWCDLAVKFDAPPSVLAELSALCQLRDAKLLMREVEARGTDHADSCASLRRLPDRCSCDLVGYRARLAEASK